MSSVYAERLDTLRQNPKTWLVTGVAGFIGSNILETLLLNSQHVVGLDNFATGRVTNLDDVRSIVGEDVWRNFRFIEGDIVDIDTCKESCRGVDVVLHQAALGSVPRSVADPINSNRVNVDGQLNMLVAARDAGIKRLVYAGSSSTYGDHPDLPKVEDRIGKPLSPYAVTKYVNELYAQVFASSFGLSIVGLRYFNVFGRRQNPNGEYAAVIPKWIGNILDGRKCIINGDGETSRDFCFVENVVQANILAATAEADDATNQVYNVAFGGRTTLNELFNEIKRGLSHLSSKALESTPEYAPFRQGDVRHSLADISKATRLLGYSPQFSLPDGLEQTLPWYVEQHLSGSI